MRSIVIAAVAASLLALGNAPAHAGADSEYAGGCGLAAAAHQAVTSSPDVYAGVMWDATVAYSRIVTDNPVSIEVTCALVVNGSPVYVSPPDTGTVVTANAWQVAYYATPLDVVQVCESVDFTTDATPTVSHCALATMADDPPQEVTDLLDTVTQPAVDGVWSSKILRVDPVVCPVFRAAWFSVPGVVEITKAEGDVKVLGGTVYDCPVYSTPPPSYSVPPTRVQFVLDV